MGRRVERWNGLKDYSSKRNQQFNKSTNQITDHSSQITVQQIRSQITVQQIKQIKQIKQINKSTFQQINNLKPNNYETSILSLQCMRQRDCKTH